MKKSIIALSLIVMLAMIGTCWAGEFEMNQRLIGPDSVEIAATTDGGLYDIEIFNMGSSTVYVTVMQTAPRIYGYPDEVMPGWFPIPAGKKFGVTGQSHCHFTVSCAIGQTSRIAWVWKEEPSFSLPW